MSEITYEPIKREPYNEYAGLMAILLEFLTFYRLDVENVEGDEQSDALYLLAKKYAEMIDDHYRERQNKLL